MPKVKVTSKFQITEMTDGFINQGLVDQVGQAVVEDMKEAMARGTSPVEGRGKFAPYKNPEKYPGRRKPSRVVNLFLTGKLYESLGWRRKGSSIEIGVMDEEVAIYAQAHNEGTDVLPKRQFLPGPNDSFLASTMRKVLAIYRDRLSAIIKQSNKSG